MTTTSVPALTRTYSARVNVPYGSNNTTALLIHQYAAWSLYMHLTDQHSTGTTSTNARAANSVWTVRQSCDSVAAGTIGDGVDRWTTTFTPSKLVRAADGTAHSWMVLRNTASGLECCIDLNSVSDGTASISFCRYAVGPFTPNATPLTHRPTCTASATEEWQCGNRSAPLASTNAANLLGIDFTLSGTFYSSCVFGPDATFMHFVHRVGVVVSPGLAGCFVGLWQTAGAQAADTRNWYALAHALNTGRGIPSVNTLNNPGSFAARLPDGTLQGSGGVRASPVFGGTNYCGGYVSTDYNSGKWYADPLEIRELLPQAWDRGYLPDIHTIGPAAINSSYPSAAAQTHLVLGDCLIPFPAPCTLLM